MNVEPQTLVIPFMFEMERNILRVASDKSTGAQTQTYPVINEINTILARYNEYQMQSGKCYFLFLTPLFCFKNLLTDSFFYFYFS